MLLLITASVPGTAAWRQCQICFVLRLLTPINPGRHIGATIDAMNRLTPALQAPRTARMDAKQVDSSAFQVQVGEAATRIEAAEALIMRAADEVDAAAGRGETLALPVRTRMRARASYAGTQITEAIGILLSAHGAGSFAESNPLQRMWRDANVASRHVALLHPVAMEVHGRALLGVEKNIAFLI